MRSLYLGVPISTELAFVFALEGALLQRKRDRIRVVAVKVDDDGWMGVTTAGQRCHGHRHDTPEQAKLCALHRDRIDERPLNIVLLPLAKPSTAIR